MNALDQAIVDYCKQFDLPCERSLKGWMINGTEFECVYWDNDQPVYVQGNRRVLYISNLDVQIAKLHEWLFRKPTAKIEKLKIETVVAEVGSEIVLDQVLMVADGDKVTLGTPTLSGATVKAKVLAHGRADKVHIYKMRRRKHYRKSQGHRQNYTEI